VALLLACGPAAGEPGTLDRTQEPARQTLAQCRPTYGRADLAARLRDARKLLARSDAPNQQIYVLTDMQRASWQGGDQALHGGSPQEAEGAPPPVAGTLRAPSAGKAASDSEAPLVPGGGAAGTPGHAPSNGAPDGGPSADPAAGRVPVIVVDCNRQPKPNVAVETLDVHAPAPISGVPVRITATLLNTSPVAQERLVELLIDGVKVDSSPELGLPPGGRVKHEFHWAFDRGGLHRGAVRLAGDDGSKYDDCRYFAIEINPAAPVAVVKARQHEIPYLDDAFYLERAFDGGGSGGPPPTDAAGGRPGEGGETGAVRATTLLAADLAVEPLERYRVVFCVNLPPLSAEVADRLRTYVEGGGSLVWIAGDNVEPAAYNRMNELAEGRLLPAPLAQLPARAKDRDAWHIAWIDGKHPALARLTSPPSLYQSVLVYQRVGMAAGGAQARVLARLDDGQPLLVERGIGRGRALMLATGMQVGWSNLPLRQIFLPLVTQLTLELSGVRPGGTDLLAGQPIGLDLAGRAQPVEVEVTRPSGETLRLNSASESGRAGQVFRYADTYEIGVYVLRLLGAAPPARFAYAVNSDPAEADPAKIEPRELQRQLGGSPLVMAASADDLSGTFALLREGRGLGEPLLLGVLIFLVFETLLANRIVPPRAGA
jgi:hypothetical protein